jgi:hypothetical protein
VPPDLQAKAAVMNAEAEAVTVGDGNTGGGGSGGNKDNSGDSDGGCTDKNNPPPPKNVGRLILQYVDCLLFFY